MTVEALIDEPRDQFPIGMRVLAVDDDPTCLLLLETLLRRCKYHVTTTSQAIVALKMLRENKNKFDLVISDVHMPDMDGFKLLELVGLEMDLPVIMLSANGDSKLVMKGITHGACDYLLKPIRIEELKNIWQHVIRRKRFDSKDKNNFENQEKLHTETGEGGQVFAGNSDINGKFTRKRKDQNEDEIEEHDETENDNEDPSTQKKPRVVWSVDLHRKFVSAVNQLGIDKAVPKKILDLMNVEKLTRENVASHLQKYRLYLKRISCVANQQANMVAALSGTDSSYLRMGSFNGLANYHNLAGSGQLQNTGFKSFPSGGMISRLNTPAGLGMCGFPSSGIIQLGHGQNSSSFSDAHGKFQPLILSGNHNGNIIQGMPASIELDQLQNDKAVTSIRGHSTAMDNKSVFPVPSSFPKENIATDSSTNPHLGFTSNPLMLEGHPLDAHSASNCGNQSSVTVPSLNSELSSHSLDHRRCDGNWSSSVQSSRFQSNSFQLNDCFRPVILRPSSLRDTTSTTLQFGNNSGDISSITPMPSQLLDSRTDLQCQAGLLNSNVGLNVNNATQQVFDDHKPNAPYQSNIICSSVNSRVPVDGVLGSLGQSLNQKSTNFCGRMDFNLIEQSNHVNTISMNHDEMKKSSMGTLSMNEGYLGQRKSNDSYVSTSLGSLEDLVSAMMKREQDNVKVTEGDLGCDSYSLETCI